MQPESPDGATDQKQFFRLKSIFRPPPKRIQNIFPFGSKKCSLPRGWPSKRNHLLFAVLWASQGEFTSYLRCSGHARANSLAIYCVLGFGTLGMPGRIRSLFTVLWASQSERIRYLLYSGHAKANSLAISSFLGIPKRIHSRFVLKDKVLGIRF